MVALQVCEDMTAGSREVLSLYRRILRLSRTWVALDPSQTQVERDYIRDEARHLFKDNKQVTILIP